MVGVEMTVAQVLESVLRDRFSSRTPAAVSLFLEASR